MSLSGYIEAGLSDHKPVCVVMKRTDIRAQAALAETSVPEGGAHGVPLAGSLLHDAGSMQGTSHAGGDYRAGVVAILNAALDHVSRFRKHANAPLKEWNELRELAEEAILAEKASLDWKYLMLNPMPGNAAMRSSKAEREILCRAAIRLGAKLPQNFVRVTEPKSDVDDEEEHLQFEDDDTDDDGDLENVEEDECVDVEERKVRALVRRLLHNARGFSGSL